MQLLRPPLPVVSLAKLVHQDDEQQLLATRGIGRGVSLRVVSTVGRGLEGVDRVPVLDRGQVLVVVERSGEAIHPQFCQDQVVPVDATELSQAVAEVLDRPVHRNLDSVQLVLAVRATEDDGDVYRSGVPLWEGKGDADVGIEGRGV